MLLISKGSRIPFEDEAVPHAKSAITPKSAEHEEMIP
jgi:hypothetical protein